MTTPCPPHHYVLETPNGLTVPGVCKRCGAKRVYETALGWRGSPAIPGRGFGRKAA